MQAYTYGTTSTSPATSSSPAPASSATRDRVQAARLALSPRPNEVLKLDQGEEPGGAGGAARSGRGLGQAAMKAKQTGARWEITVDGKPRSYRDDRQIAIESAQYLKRKNPNVEVTVRD